MNDDVRADEPTHDEERLVHTFRGLRAPAAAGRRWEEAARSADAARPARPLRRVALGRSPRRLAPVAVAGILAAVAGAAGLALGLHDRETSQRIVVPSTHAPTPAPPTPAPTEITSPVATPISTPSAVPSPTVATCSPISGGAPGAPAQLTAVRVAHQTGFDRVTFEFKPPQAGAPLGNAVGVPGYTITPQASAVFTRDASGATVVAQGTAGLRIVFQDTSGVGLDGSPTYTGADDLRPALSELREVVRLGDFERVLTWGVGLTAPECPHVTELSGPVRVVVDVPAGG